MSASPETSRPTSPKIGEPAQARSAPASRTDALHRAHEEARLQQQGRRHHRGDGAPSANSDALENVPNGRTVVGPMYSAA